MSLFFNTFNYNFNTFTVKKVQHCVEEKASAIIPLSVLPPLVGVLFQFKVFTTTKN